MTTPNIQTSNLTKATDGNPDGQLIGSSASDRVGMYGNNPTSQRTTPVQAIVQGFALGSLLSTQFTVANVAIGANAANENPYAAAQAFCNGTAPLGTATTDLVFAVNYFANANIANLGIGGYRCSNAANQIMIVNVNPANATANVGPSSTYNAAIIRGMNVISANLTVAANLVPNSAIEQIFNIAPAGAVANVTISGGAVNVITVANAGTGYYVAPTVQIVPNNTGAYGASAVAIIDGVGHVSGVKVTNGGTGYTVAPTINFLGGMNVTPGMFLVAQRNGAGATGNFANVGIGNVRVVGNNQIGITYINVGTANVAVTANDAFRIFATNSMTPITQDVQLAANVVTGVATGTFVANGPVIVCPSITANDAIISTQSTVTACAANMAMAIGQCTTGNYAANFYANAITPTAGILSTIRRNAPGAPIAVYAFNASGTANIVASNATQEVIYTLPSNVTIPACNVVNINRVDAPQGNLTIVGCRANSNTTVAVLFMNTSSANITTSNTAQFLLAAVDVPCPTLAAVNANTTGVAGQVPIGMTFQQMIDLQNEMQQSLVNVGMIKGA